MMDVMARRAGRKKDPRGFVSARHFLSRTKAGERYW